MSQFVSPFAFCSDNAINRFDADGNTDWKLVKKRASTTLEGIGSLVSGGIVAGLSSGTCAAIGAFLFVEGWCATGVGTSMMIAGFLTPDEKVDENLSEMIPTTPSNALSKSGDIILGTDNHEIETITSVFTTALSGSSFSIRPKTVGDIVSNLSTSIQVLERAQDVKGLMKAKLQDDSQTMSVSDEERYIYNEQWQKYLWTPK